MCTLRSNQNRKDSIQIEHLGTRETLQSFILHMGHIEHDFKLKTQFGDSIFCIVDTET